MSRAEGSSTDAMPEVHTTHIRHIYPLSLSRKGGIFTMRGAPALPSAPRRTAPARRGPSRVCRGPRAVWLWAPTTFNPNGNAQRRRMARGLSYAPERAPEIAHPIIACNSYILLQHDNAQALFNIFSAKR